MKIKIKDYIWSCISSYFLFLLLLLFYLPSITKWESTPSGQNLLVLVQWSDWFPEDTSLESGKDLKIDYNLRTRSFWMAAGMLWLRTRTKSKTQRIMQKQSRKKERMKAVADQNVEATDQGTWRITWPSDAELAIPSRSRIHQFCRADYR